MFMKPITCFVQFFFFFIINQNFGWMFVLFFNFFYLCKYLNGACGGRSFFVVVFFVLDFFFMCYKPDFHLDCDKDISQQAFSNLFYEPVNPNMCDRQHLNFLSVFGIEYKKNILSLIVSFLFILAGIKTNLLFFVLFSQGGGGGSFVSLLKHFHKHK